MIPKIKKQLSVNKRDHFNKRMKSIKFNSKKNYRKKDVADFVVMEIHSRHKLIMKTRSGIKKCKVALYIDPNDKLNVPKA